MPSVTRFLHAYVRPDSAAVRVDETVYRRGDADLPATVYRPRAAGAFPGWVVLHGLTWSGREHPSLIRFARAIAAAGNIVLIPDIPEWRALRVDTSITVATIRAAVRALQAMEDLEHEHAGLFGFSFGATQSLIAATEPEVRDSLHGIAAWGGFADVHRLFRFGLLGEHDLDGTAWHLDPDPYGCWIVTGNFLTRLEGYEEYGDVASALHELALEAGRRGLYAWDAAFDRDKRRLRDAIAPAHRELFDWLAPITTGPQPQPDVVRPLARGLADAAMRADPLFDPTPFLPRVEIPVLLAHGRHDRLIPWTETIRLSRALPADVLNGTTITGLYQHSGGAAPGLGPVSRMREMATFVDLLRRVLRLPVR